MKACMDEACEAVLGDGYVLKSERDVVQHPAHYAHEDGQKMWTKIEAALDEVGKKPPMPPANDEGSDLE